MRLRLACTLAAVVLSPLVAQDTFNGKTARGWMEQLHSTSEADRDRAESALGGMHDRALRVVVGAFDDADREVRLRALRLAARLGTQIADQADRLRAFEADPFPEIQVAARAALLRATARADDLAAITAALGDSASSVVIAAAQALADLGVAAAPAVPALVAVLGKQGEFYEAVKVIAAENQRTQTKGVHLEVVRALGTLHEVAGPAVPVLVEMLHHPSPWVVGAAIDALGAFGAAADAAIPALIGRLESADWNERRDVAIALGEIAAAVPGTQDDVVRALIGRLADDVGYVRRASCNTLRALGAEAAAATPALVEFLRSADRRSQGARENAIEALGAIGPAAKEAAPLLEEMAAKDDSLADDAVRALANVAPETGKRLPAVAARLAEVETSRLPYEAQRDRRIQTELAVLSGTDERAKAAAVIALGWEFARSAEGLLVSMLDQHPAPRLCNAIIGVLGDLGARSAAAKIRPLLDEPATREVAAFTLARFGDAVSMPRLLKLFAENPEGQAALAIVFGANGVREAAPVFARSVPPVGAAAGDRSYYLRLARIFLRDPSCAAAVRKQLDALAQVKDMSVDDRLARQAELLTELAAEDPAGHRDVLLAHLADPEPAEVARVIASGLARVQEARAFPILLAAEDYPALGWYLSPALLQQLDGMWLEATEWEHVPVSQVVKTIATRLPVEVAWSPTVTAAHQREAFDWGEAYEFVPRGLRMRALQWLDSLSTFRLHEADGALAWLPIDGKVSIVLRSEAAAFWREEAERRAQQAAKQPAGK